MPLLATDLDGTLIGQTKWTTRFERLYRHFFHEDEGWKIAFITGRTHGEFQHLKAKKKFTIEPDWFAVSTGCEVWRRCDKTGNDIRDEHYHNHNMKQWDREAIAQLAREVPGLVEQPEKYMHELRLSYLTGKESHGSAVKILLERVKERELQVKCIGANATYVDLCPPTAGKGGAFDHILTNTGYDHGISFGDSGNDIDMFEATLRGGGYCVAVANRSEELQEWIDQQPDHGRIYQAKTRQAIGMVEGLSHFQYLPDELGADLFTPGEEDRLGDMLDRWSERVVSDNAAV